MPDSGSRRSGAWAGVILAAALLISAIAPVNAQTQSSGSDERAVRAAFDAIQEAVVGRDIERLSDLVHPRFAMLHALGQIDTREAWFGLISSGQLPRQTADRREIGPEVVVTGDTALIRSLVQMTYRAEGRAGWMRSTAVFTREGGRWRQINQQSSYLFDGPVVTATSLADFVGTYEISGREGFSIHARDGYLELVWANGAVLPLVPRRTDSFAAGPTSAITFEREPSGRVGSAIRTGDNGRPWWTAQLLRQGT